MRTFEQRMEEIRRRGMQLRQKRRRRQLTSAVVCTLVLFSAGLWMAFSKPATAPSVHLQYTPSPTQPTTTEKPEYSLHSPTAPRLQLEVRQGGSMHLYTDPAQLAEIQSLLDDFIAVGDFVCSEDDAVTEAQTGCLTDSATETELVFTLDQEITDSYALEGNVLTDRITGGRYILTQETLEKLNQLLGKDDGL